MRKLAAVSQLSLARAAAIIDRTTVITLEQYDPIIPEPPAPSKEEVRRLKARIARHKAIQMKSRVQPRPCRNDHRSGRGRR